MDLEKEMAQDLCSACRSITTHALTQRLEEPPTWWAEVADSSKPFGMKHLESAKVLPQSSLQCRLCKLMYDSIREAPSRHHFPPEATENLRDGKGGVQGELDELALQSQLLEEPIYLCPKRDTRGRRFPEVDLQDSWNLRAFAAYVPIKGDVLTGLIRLFALQDSPASKTGIISGRPYLPSSNCPQAHDLLRRWLSSCMQNHQGCRKTCSGSPLFAENQSEEHNFNKLPTRVIDIGNPLDNSLRPRLVESKGLKAPYATLSHCWGPPEKRPLMTTSLNLHNHLSSIQWTDLPKTFQDAIEITKEIGLRYIWIDSLCIVQDDRDDWLRESQLMGEIYERSRLTIAASHAADSSIGCFIPRPPLPPIIRLSNTKSNAVSSEHIYATTMPTDYNAISPEFGVLNNRGWATQEWLLSRRIIFYTAGCLAWSCKEVTQRETGGNFHSTARNMRWKYVVEKYTARHLTKPTDRLIALEGLRTELQKKIYDGYAFGIWAATNTLDQLLWFGTRKLDRSSTPLDVPTYTWASTMCAVYFMNVDLGLPQCTYLESKDPRAIVLRGALETDLSFLPFDSTPEQSHLTDNLYNNGDKFALRRRDSFAADTRNTVPLEMGWAILDARKQEIGWAILDEAELPHAKPVMVLILLNSWRKSKASTSKPVGQQERVDWLLLLQKPTLESESYRRVGVGRTQRFSQKPQKNAKAKMEIVSIT